MDHQVELDRRMLDWIVGLDTEMNELVEGSHLYTPKVFCLPLSPDNRTAELPKYLEEALSLIKFSHLRILVQINGLTM